MLTDTRRSTHTIGLIDIRGKDGVKIEGITLGEFQSDRGIQVAPRTDISGKVIAHRQAQLVDQRYLLKAGRVFIALYFHLHVVSEFETYQARLTRPRR